MTNLNIKRCFLNLAFAIINVQASARCALNAQSGQQAPRILPRFARRQRRLLRWKYMAASDVHGDMSQGCLDGCVLPGLCFDRRLRVPIVINLAFSYTRKDAIDGYRALGEDRGDQDGGTEEKL